MYDASNLKKGLKIQIDNEPYVITGFDFSKPGKGQAIYKVKMRNMLSGANFDRSYRSNDKFHPANLMSKKMDYLYCDGNSYCFMDPESYENHFADENVIADIKNFLLENTTADVLFFGERIIEVTLPMVVKLKITKSDPGVRGDTATNVTKPATLETGYTVQVPIFIEEGDYIKVDTRTGAYVERAKD